ncbi:hypothetical protein LQW54_000638 [Pestalotiopsis sp. IQ-011]
MTWFPVAVYRWVQDSIRRVPAAILTRLGILDAPSDNGQETLVQVREDEEQQSPRQRHNSQETLALPIEDEEQQSPRQRQPPNDVNAWPPYRYRDSFYRSSMYAFPDDRVHNVWPSSQPTNGPQQATEAAGAAGPGYSGNDAGQGQTGYRTPDPDSGYDSMG